MDSTARTPCPNKNWFSLTGGHGYSFQELFPEEKLSQREEAFAGATVALTRAQCFCFIMCPLDMKGIIGAATVVGCLQHGAGVCDEQSTGSSLLVELKASSLASSREDGNFLAALQHSATVKTGEFPPAALVELYHEPGAVAARLRPPLYDMSSDARFETMIGP